VLVNISAAARMASKTRRTIYKHIEQGKLSLSRDSKGNKGIEVSELIRVYGDDVKRPSTQKNSKRIQSEYAGVSSEEKLDLLLKKIESLEAEIKNLNNRLEYKPVPVDNNLTVSAPVVEKPAPTKTGYSSIIDKMKAGLVERNKKN